MFTQKSTSLLIALTLTVLPVAAMAQTETAPASPNAAAEGHHNWKNMTPEQREQAKTARKAKWDAMTPEQKQAAKAERKAKFDALPPEKQAEIKARREQRHEHRKEMHENKTGTTEAPVAK